MAELEMLNNSYDIVTNCEHNVDVLTQRIKQLHQNINDVMAIDESVDLGAPSPPKTDYLNRAAWHYVIDVFKWCQRWTNATVNYGMEYSLTDEMGNFVSSVSLWIPYTRLSLGDKKDTSFVDHINHNWKLIGAVFDQLDKNFETMYQ